MAATFKLLLDEHVWPPMALRLRDLLPGAHIESLHHWMGRRLLQQPDERILLEAYQAGMTLLTFDLSNIPSLLTEILALGEEHGGVIFVSTKSFPQNDHGRLIHAILESWPNWSAEPWTNRVEFPSTAITSSFLRERVVLEESFEFLGRGPLEQFNPHPFIQSLDFLDPQEGDRRQIADGLLDHPILLGGELERRLPLAGEIGSHRDSVAAPFFHRAAEADDPGFAAHR